MADDVSVQRARADRRAVGLAWFLAAAAALGAVESARDAAHAALAVAAAGGVRLLRLGHRHAVRALRRHRGLGRARASRYGQRDVESAGGPGAPAGVPGDAGEHRYPADRALPALARRPAAPARVRTSTDVRYGPHPDRRLRDDVAPGLGYPDGAGDWGHS